MHTESNRGILVAVEGIDGAGKSTVVNALSDQIRRAETPVTVTKRYMIGELTALWRHLLQENQAEPSLAAVLAAADYALTRDRYVRPALNRGEIVLADRYVYSHLVHFELRQVPADQLVSIFHPLLVPDLILYLDVSVHQALGRLQKSGKPDYLEAGLDYRLGLKIGDVHARYDKSLFSNDLLAHHFRAHQSTAQQLFQRILPVERTHVLTADAPVDQLVQVSWAKIQEIARQRTDRPG